MKLYHFSFGKYPELIPMFGKNRNSSEDKRIVGKPVIWLTADGKYFGYEGKPYLYRYTVELEETDIDLIRDENLYLSSNGDVRWYAYLKELKEVNVEKWNESEFVYK